VVVESLDILQWLEDQVSGTPLLPESLGARKAMEQLLGRCSPLVSAGACLARAVCLHGE